MTLARAASVAFDSSEWREELERIGLGFVGRGCKGYRPQLRYQLMLSVVAVVVGSVVAAARRSKSSRRRQEAKGKEEVAALGVLTPPGPLVPWEGGGWSGRLETLDK